MFSLVDHPPRFLKYSPNLTDPSSGTINFQDQTITLPLDMYHKLLNRHCKNEKLDQFFMYIFKVKQCSKKRAHDWTECPFAHHGEKARRRDPMKFPYQGVICPEFRLQGQCKRGSMCEFSHGIFEFWLHPSRFRTRLCESGLLCPRKVCFFAHNREQLRPTIIYSPVPISAAVIPNSSSNVTERLLLNASSSSSSSSSSGNPQDDPNDMFADYAHMDLIVDVFSSFDD